MGAKKTILNLESQLIKIKEELELAKKKEAGELFVNITKVEDGEWIHLESESVIFIIKYKHDNISFCESSDNIIKVTFYYYYMISTPKHPMSSAVINYCPIKNYSFNENNTACLAYPQFNTRYATEVEIKDALFKIAESKGFKKGVSFKSKSSLDSKYDLSFYGHPILTLTNLVFDDGKLWDELSHRVIYIDLYNQWAEIVQDFEIVPGYPVKYINSESCSIDGITYHVDYIENLLEILLTSSVIKSFGVGCKDQFKIERKNLIDLLDNWPDKKESKLNYKKEKIFVRKHPVFL